MVETQSYELEFDLSYEGPGKTMNISGLTPVTAIDIFGNPIASGIGTLDDIAQKEEQDKYETEKAEYVYKRALEENPYEDVITTLGKRDGYYPCDGLGNQCSIGCLYYNNCPKGKKPKVEEPKPKNSKTGKKAKRKKKKLLR